uniref:Secreted RxLR effector protein 93 n=1 Tax=Plasmopara viticola TaxID=143451 RepID=RLR93_PLAVT|nr:RecName: Full=Secreted RxLR effector protein 93; Flags: Precursor [Plasmopara viticola]
MRFYLTKLFAAAGALAWTTGLSTANAVTTPVSPLSRSSDHHQSDDSTQRRLRTLNGADEERMSPLTMTRLRAALAFELELVDFDSLAQNQFLARVREMLGIKVTGSTTAGLPKMIRRFGVKNSAKNVAKRVQDPAKQADLIAGLLIYPVKQRDLLGDELLRKWPYLTVSAIKKRVIAEKNRKVHKKPRPFAAHVHAPTIAAY